MGDDLYDARETLASWCDDIGGDFHQSTTMADDNVRYICSYNGDAIELNSHESPYTNNHNGEVSVPEDWWFSFNVNQAAGVDRVDIRNGQTVEGDEVTYRSDGRRSQLIVGDPQSRASTNFIVDQ